MRPGKPLGTKRFGKYIDFARKRALLQQSFRLTPLLAKRKSPNGRQFHTLYIGIRSAISCAKRRTDGKKFLTLRADN